MIDKNKQKIITLDGVVDWHALFPRAKTKTGRPDMRKKMTRHQREKINAALETFKAHGGANKFRKKRKSSLLDRLQKVSGSPKGFRGYFSAAEIKEKKQTAATKRAGRSSDFEFTFTHESGRQFVYSVYAFEPALSASELKNEIREAFSRVEENPRYMGIMNNSDNYLLTDADDIETLIDDAVIDFEKYAALADAGGYREKSRKYGSRKAAHPSEWMRGLSVPQ